MSRLWVVVFGLAWVTGCEGPAFTSREAVSLGDGGGQDLASETDAGDTPETGSDPRVVVAEAGGDAGVPVDVEDGGDAAPVETGSSGGSSSSGAVAPSSSSGGSSSGGVTVVGGSGSSSGISGGGSSSGSSGGSSSSSGGGGPLCCMVGLTNSYPCSALSGPVASCSGTTCSYEYIQGTVESCK